MKAALNRSSHSSIRRHLLVGLAIVLFLAVAVGGWAATTPLAGAVIAQGTVVVDSHVKRVQHATGGIVADIGVKNGSTVFAGEVMMRLDDTQTRAGLAIVERRLTELSGREARLAAERDGLSAIRFPPMLTERSADPVVEAVLKGETRLFKARLASRESRKAQLQERAAQLREEIGGIAAQIEGKRTEIGLIEQELTGVRELHSKGLTPVTRVNGLEREAARLEGERGALSAAIAKATGQIAEIELQILQVDEDLQSEVAAEIRDIQAQIGEFIERRIAAEDQLKRVDIRAPQNGIVHDLAVHAAGAVIGAGEPIMLIVPVADALVVDVRVDPQDIDQLRLGQTAVLRFSAFNQRTTPEISGTVARIAADLTVDAQSGRSYYLVRIATSEDELARLGSIRLLPGMPVEAFVRTQERSALSYLVKPLADQIERAFREE